jgi:hypothetical protein
MSLQVRSHLALGRISVKWDKIFHMKAISHLTRMDLLLILTLKIVFNGIAIVVAKLENTNKKY